MIIWMIIAIVSSWLSGYALASARGERLARLEKFRIEAMRLQRDEYRDRCRQLQIELDDAASDDLPVLLSYGQRP